MRPAANQNWPTETAPRQARSELGDAVFAMCNEMNRVYAGWPAVSIDFPPKSALKIAERP